MIYSIVAVLFALAGASMMCLAGIGILRMPDLFTRMHASTKGASLGVALLLIGTTIYFRDLSLGTKATLTIVFIFLTAPVAAHMLGRAAYHRKYPLWDGTKVDQGKRGSSGDDEPMS